MADVEGDYYKAAPDSENSQRMKTMQPFKASAFIFFGSCLAVFMIVTLRSAAENSSAVESINLFGFVKTPVMSAPLKVSPTVGLLPRNMNSVERQGKFLSQSFNPPLQKLPGQSRTETIIAKGFFDFLSAGNAQDDKYYQKGGNNIKWSKGNKAEYKSSRGWISCKVTDVSREGVMLDVKPGVWLSERQQQAQMRPLVVKGYKTSAGKNLALPERSNDLTAGLIEKQKELEEKFFGRR